MPFDGQQLDDVVFPRRRPLHDCTNIVLKETGEETTKQTFKTRGHWKRQARLKGKGETMMAVDLPETRTKQDKKMDRQEEDQQ